MRTAFQQLYEWLENHPTEGLMVQMKQDGTLPPGKTPVDFANAVFALINGSSGSPHKWRLDITIPTLESIRGKIQLIRRFESPISSVQLLSSAGLQVYQGWKDNGSIPFSIKGTPGINVKNIDVQDHYEYVPADGDPTFIIADRYKLVGNMMNDAISNSKPDVHVWYFNYASAIEAPFQGNLGLVFWVFAQGYFDQLTGDEVDGVNKRIRDFIAKNPVPARYGTIMMDYPTNDNSPDLVTQFIRSNKLK